MRWKVTILYRAEHGPVDVVYYIDELCELEDLVELGPDWNTIVRIEITLNQVHTPGLTLEEEKNQ